MRLAIVCCHFNPCGFRRPRDNYLLFRDGLGGLEQHLTTVELVLDRDAPQIVDAVHLAGSRETHALWQKEHLLNAAIRQLPAAYDAVAWLDADLLFRNPQWYATATRLLEVFPVLQLFAEAHWLNAQGQVVRRDRSRGWHVQQGALADGHPGFAWAARRELIEDGLLERHISGGADECMAACWSGAFVEQWQVRALPPALRRLTLRWGAGQYRRTGGEVGYVSGSIEHLFHGRRSDRRYVARVRLLRELNYDPERDVERDGQGLLRWTGRNPALQDALLDWFAGRREDD